MRYGSICSGIEAATVAVAPLGWEPVFYAEIDPFCCALLQHYYPTVPNVGDITAVTQETMAALGPLDLIVCGFPCQDLSFAGQRKGLQHADGTPTRSGLFFTAMQIVRWARQHNGCRWLLIENVPGLFSSGQGRDFATVVGAMVGGEFAVPPSGWRNAGVCLGPDGVVEWRTLDAEYFGVPQRRHRVFALADFGDWAARPPILVDAYSLSGHPAPRRQAREDVAACLTQGVDSQGKGGYAGRRREDDVNLVTFADQRGRQNGDTSLFDLAHTLHSMKGQSESQIVAFDTTQITSKENRCNPQPGDPCRPLAAQGHAPAIAFGGNNTAGPIDTATACNAHGGTGRLDFESETFIVASESGKGWWNEGVDALRSHNIQKPEAGVVHALAFTERTRKDGRNVETLEDTAYALLNPGRGGRAQSRQVLAPCLTQNYGKQPDNSDTGEGPMLVHEGMMVRRLTPLECERLQGLPDYYTLVPYRGKPATDSPRYRAIGNSFAVPVIQWIAKRIQRVEDVLCQQR